MVALSTTATASGHAEEKPGPPTNELPTKQMAKVSAHFFTAESIQLIPKLQPLNNPDPGYNKILFTLDHYPRDKEIIFEIKRQASPHPDKFDSIVAFVILEDGTYLTKSQPPQHLGAIIASSKGFLPGERVSYRFRTADNDIDNQIIAIPHPLQFKDKNGALAMSAELITIKPTMYAIGLPTMNEGEEFSVKSVSAGETINATTKYSKNTPFHYAPEVQEKSQGGYATLEIERKSGENYKLELPWGTTLEEYLKGK